ncbi:MAG: MMPL family transporter, partial [Candidatus Omnitrophica bacterium]|nr:MMPL family transporter [Candidatus Omnitrophota bacterium]
MFKKFILYTLGHPKKIMILSAVLVALSFIQFSRIKVDTDPENMLPETAPVRVFHHDTKKEFGLYDIVVLGVVNDHHPQGAFNVETLGKIYNITESIKKIDGVITREIVALSTKDNIEQGDIGSVKFNWLMESPPKTQEEALKIRRQAEDHPMFQGSVVSQDGKAVAIYVPIEKKDISYEVARELRKITEQYQGEEEYYITGLPVAEDQFGGEMFKQMAISAPLAGLVIFLLMWFFFKSAQLVVAPMLVAVATV